MNGEFEILFCGTGAADHDWSHYGRRGVRGSCSTLLDGRVLVDCGTTGFRSLVRNGIAPRALRELWFTHSHSDHCAPAEVAALLAARGRAAAPLLLRGTAPLLARLGAALEAAGPAGRFEFRPLEPLAPFRTLGWTATALPANHLGSIPGETCVHYLVRAPGASLLYALDGAWMTTAARRAIGSGPLDLVVWDATVQRPGDWRIFEHNDLAMVRTMSARLAADGVVRPGTVQVLDHLAATLWDSPARAPRPFVAARDGLRLAAPREAAVSLGSNLGDRAENLRRALRLLAATPGVRLLARSAIYETEPVDVPPEFAGQDYLNAVAVFEVALPLDAWSARCHAVEDALGRVRTGYHHPRTIDVDLLCCGAAVRDAPHLHLPHPQIASRRFVCAPLAEVRPDLRLPGFSGTVAELLAALPPRPAVRLSAERWDRPSASLRPARGARRTRRP
ncbi:MAG: 2-amino-4-hydroxy-6-hydroxymethyldihydropteridine diphosphokinase [Kiritimatiellae bacterium]|nr:2-amino-4-hydroxy-6-hydroxymethyldihydropteridine diphosphokinase [Kiritimatiellia bacterium]